MGEIPMFDRRAILKWTLLGGGAALARLFTGWGAIAATPQKEHDAQASFERATRGMPAPRIKDVSVIQVGGGGVNDSTVVKVTTDQAGLYGYGCATATFPGGRAKLVAAFVANYEVKFAWHGAPNSPVGSMANLTLDLTNENFGIHEHIDYTPLVEDIFHGALQIKDGYAWISEKPGWGIEVDEALAAKHPITDEHPNQIRTRDGSIIQGTS